MAVWIIIGAILGSVTVMVPTTIYALAAYRRSTALLYWSKRCHPKGQFPALPSDPSPTSGAR